MATIRNMGTATMRFKEGIIASGSDDGISLDVYGNVSNQHIATFKNSMYTSYPPCSLTLDF